MVNVNKMYYLFVSVSMCTTARKLISYMVYHAASLRRRVDHENEPRLHRLIPLPVSVMRPLGDTKETYNTLKSPAPCFDNIGEGRRLEDMPRDEAAMWEA
jgi:hypothetical protein